MNEGGDPKGVDFVNFKKHSLWNRNTYIYIFIYGKFQIYIKVKILFRAYLNFYDKESF